MVMWKARALKGEDSRREGIYMEGRAGSSHGEAKESYVKTRNRISDYCNMLYCIDIDFMLCYTCSGHAPHPWETPIFLKLAWLNGMEDRGQKPRTRASSTEI